MPGFANHYAAVNGVRLHYVAGGSGLVLVCLPGWPQTWFSYHPIAAGLARHYRVLSVDIRGMGSSDKPATGHDIGGLVAASFAFNHPEAVDKLILADGAHPSEGLRQLPLLPAPGAFAGKMDGRQPYIWWMAFSQVQGLPEQLLAGRFHQLLDYLFAYVMLDESRRSAFDRAACNEPENIRAARAWHQALADASTYPRLAMPVLAIGSCVFYSYLQMSLPYVAENVQVVGLLSSGHYMFEEKAGRSAGLSAVVMRLGG